IGIPQADRERILETFYRATNVGTISGTGLGLAIVKRAVELHGGQLAIDSQEGKGTTFTITLPLICASI
ncbi:MAG TPA: ATP-binding protein, partial [Microcoleus sp.]|nr:ATP-binding protein [Microcoleus sp.]